MTDWISVKDKLPDLDQVVMICWPSGYDGSARYSWGARLDDSDGWLWGITQAYGCWIDPAGDASKNSIEADDDYPVQFWKPIDPPPTLTKS